MFDASSSGRMRSLSQATLAGAWKARDRLLALLFVSICSIIYAFDQRLSQKVEHA